MKRKQSWVIFGFEVAFFLTGLVLVGCSSHRQGDKGTRAEGFDTTSPGDFRNTSGIVNGSSTLGFTGKGLSQSVVALVAARGRGEALCTGSIIGKNVILTAAHCVDGNPERMLVVFAPNVRTSEHGDRREVDSYTQHPAWKHSGRSSRHSPQGSPEEGRGDLAVVHFSGDLPEGYSPLELAPKDLSLESEQSVLMMGYGVVSGLTEEGSGELRKTQTVIIGQISATEVLTDGKKTSVCFGDSGGPAFVKSGKSWVQWGVASSVTNRACNEASVHTAIMQELGWIHKVASELSKN